MNAKKGIGPGARPPGLYLLPPWDKVEGGKKGRVQEDLLTYLLTYPTVVLCCPRLERGGQDDDGDEEED